MSHEFTTAATTTAARKPGRIARLLRAAVSPVVNDHPQRFGLFEKLEERNLKSVTIDTATDTVNVWGTSNNDVVQLDMYTSQVWQPGFTYGSGYGGPTLGGFVTKTFIDVIDNGVTHTFDAGSVSLVRAFLYSGNDLLDVKVPTGGFVNLFHNTIDFTKSILAYGYDGNDSLEGGTGNDSLYGNNGNDRMWGREGDDRLYGNNDNDTMYGQEGNDYLHGGSGSDYHYGHGGNDTAYGSDGNDYFSMSSGNDYVSAGDGNDTAYGSTGNDTLYGGRHNDRLDGWDGHDLIVGNDGNDSMYGGRS
ncbi:MAG: calcium-binding protein, partial [Planctomycetota bacterium]